MIGIVVPAHDEEAYLKRCLYALDKAGTHPALQGEQVEIHIVLDHCGDGSEDIVRQFSLDHTFSTCRVSFSSVACCNVGAARAAGAQYVLQQGVRWLAFTDADTVVSPAWLVNQLSLGTDVVCGSVTVEDWTPHGENADMLRAHFSRTYNDADGHHHIHGANMGVSAQAYRMAGGFPPLPCHEDVALVAALEKIGATFCWSAAPRVTTSARTDARARSGFGDTMLAVVASQPQGNAC